jgi:PAS domain S-box-containing protein
MEDRQKTKQELIEELTALRREVADLRAGRIGNRRSDRQADDEERRFRAMVDSAPFAMSVMGADRSFEYFNLRFVETFGYDKADIPDKDAWFRVVYPDPVYRRTAVERWHNITSEGPSPADGRPGVFLIRSKDGSDRHVSMRAVNLEDGRQLMSYEDVTEHVRAKSELKEAVSILSATLDAVADGVLVIGRKGRMKTFNRQFARMWKIPPELLESKQDEQAINIVLQQLRDPGSFQERIKQLYDEPETESFDRLEFKDGRVFEAFSMPNLLEEKIIGRVWSFRDITKQARAEEALRESKQRLDLALRGARLGLWDWNLQTGEVVSGLRAAELLGYATEEIQLHDTDWEKQIHPEDKPRVMEAWNRHLKGIDLLYEAEYRLRSASGDLKWILDLGMVSERDESGKAVRATGVNLDISRRKQAEQALLDKTEAVEQANRDLEQFAYSVSHDLQQPLRAVAGYLRLIERRYKGRLDEKGDRHISRCIVASDRMQSLISDLLEYSKLAAKSSSLEQVDCNHVVSEALADLHNLLITSEAVITTDRLPTVPGDQVLLHILFVNLFTNAVKFRSYEQPRIHVRAEQSGNEWVFSVKDNGIGIAPEYHERIFDIFHRLHDDSEYPGTGIGLATCKKTVERHGGRIWVESQSGSGSTFCFTLPAGTDGAFL